MDVIWIANLKHEDQCHDLDAEFSPIYVISKKEVVCVGRVAEFFEDVNEIKELSVNITNYHEWID
jgi:hypothetical protein